MAQLFHVSCKLPAVGLYELNDGRFQLIEQGPLAPFMSGYRYLIVERQLAAYLNDIGIERVRQESVVLFNRGTGEEFRTHVRLHGGQYFTPDDVRDLALDGPRLLTMNDHYYFVSTDLKALLESHQFAYLQFSEGLSDLAGSAA